MKREQIVRMVINNGWVLVNLGQQFVLEQFDQRCMRTNPFNLTSADLKYIYDELERYLAEQANIYETRTLAQKESQPMPEDKTINQLVGNPDTKED